MSYRSQVHICIEKGLFDVNCAIQPDLLAAFDGARVHHVRHYHQGTEYEFKAYYWSYHYVKWYDMYNDVQTIMAFLNDLMEDDTKPQNPRLANPLFGFIRLGEDVEDTEVLGRPDVFNMYVERSVEFGE